MRRRRLRREGFSVLEVLLATTIFFLAVLASLEFFGKAGRMFIKLKESEEEALAAGAALDKMRIDLARAGQGLIPVLSRGILEGISAGDTKLSVFSREKILYLSADVSSGAAMIPLVSVEGVSAGSEICFHDPRKGEVHTVSAVNGKVVYMTAPLESGYKKEDSSLLLIEKITFFLDPKTNVLRRQVNLSPAQPLLEDVQEFEFSFEKELNAAGLGFRLISHAEKEHELWVYPKNAGLGAVWKE
jgi:hypothetical protein